MAEKPLNFDDYNNYNDTTQGQYQEYCRNQNAITKEMVETLFWQAQTTYSLGQVAMSTNIPMGKWAVCVQAGTSGSTEPTNWNDTTTDGTVVWQLSPISIVVDASIAAGGANPVTGGAIYNALLLKQNAADPAALAVADQNGNVINFTAAGIMSKLGTTAVNRAVADQNGNIIDGIVDDKLDDDSTHPIQNKVVYAAINALQPGQKNITITASQQSAITTAADYGSGRTYLYTHTGLPAQTATLQNIIQKLVNLSHSHTSGSWNCNCDCNCTCDCSGGE